MTLILKKASNKAMNYACKNFHYSKSLPVACFGFAVFQDDIWCGCVLFGRGATQQLPLTFNLVQGQVLELTRVALNGKQHKTSEIVARSIKLLRKYCPLVKIIISYADTEHNHLGIIYQATNWKYFGKTHSISHIDPEDGKRKHSRTLNAKYGHVKGFQIVKDKPKHKYLYFYDKKLENEFKDRFKPYPKCGLSVISCTAENLQKETLQCDQPAFAL